MSTKDYNNILSILCDTITIDKSGFSGEEQISGLFVAAEKIENYFKEKKNVAKT